LEQITRQPAVEKPDEPEMAPGKYEWEKVPQLKATADEKQLVIPKIKVCMLVLTGLPFSFRHISRSWHCFYLLHCF